MEKKTLIRSIAIAVCGLIVGFAGGYEYRGYEIRKAFTDALGDLVSDSQPASKNGDQVTPVPSLEIIESPASDEIVLSTMKVKVVGSEEKQILIPKYGSPKTAKEGAKYVVVNIKATNITNDRFDFPSDFPVLVDDQERKFHTNLETSLDNYLMYRALGPAIPEQGYVIFEVPSDLSAYSLWMAKDGTNKVYTVKLK